MMESGWERRPPRSNKQTGVVTRERGQRGRGKAFKKWRPATERDGAPINDTTRAGALPSLSLYLSHFEAGGEREADESETALQRSWTCDYYLMTLIGLSICLSFPSSHPSHSLSVDNINIIKERRKKDDGSGRRAINVSLLFSSLSPLLFLLRLLHLFRCFYPPILISPPFSCMHSSRGHFLVFLRAFLLPPLKA